ncbi:MAG: hypothetical protein J5685_12280 [Clostridiales bacterium]|nr:hypothetical protein [Clostridiales bacterium]
MDNVGYIKTYEVTIVESGSKEESALVVESGEDLATGASVIRCTLNGQEIVSSHEVYFAAFQQFRDKLLEAGYGIKCNGSRLNAVSLSKKESGQVYIVGSNKRARPEDIANIWDKADIDDFPDSKAQNEFYDRWSSRFQAIDERKERIRLAGIRLLILVPLCTIIIFLLVIVDRIRVYRHIWTTIALICAVFSMTIGLVMASVGFFKAIKRKMKLFIFLGAVVLFCILLMYLATFILLSFNEGLFGGPP